MPRRILFIAAIAIVTVIAAIAVIGQDRPEFTTKSPQAWRYYEQGEEALNAFRNAAAESLLGLSLRLDPAFAMAHAAYAEALGGRGNPKERKRHLALADSLAKNLRDENERMLIQLRLAGNDGKRFAARDSLLKLLEIRIPEQPQVLVAKARRAFNIGDADAEETAWREVLRVDPNYSRGYNWLGYLAANQGRYVEALSYLRRYAFLVPESPNPHDSLGEIYAFMGEYEAAEQEYRQALQKDGTFSPSLIGLVTVYVNQGRLRRAQELLEETRKQFAGTQLEHGVDDAAAYLLLASGHAREAEIWMERVIEHGGKAEARGFYAVLILARRGKVSEARALADSLDQVWTNEPVFQQSETLRRRAEVQGRTLRAIVAAFAGEPQVEVAEWGRALIAAHRFPPHQRAPLQWWYGEALYRLGHYEQALEQSREILGSNPRLVGPLLLRVRCQLALRQSDDARATLARLDAALARADADLPAVAEADSLRRHLGARPTS